MDKITLQTAIKNLLIKANTIMDKDSYDLLLKIKNNDLKSKIVKNCEIAKELSRPLCQDTGQVIVFLKIPFNFSFNYDFKKVINETVENVYINEFYRKSVVKNALFDRANTKTNTPCIIYTDFEDRKNVEIDVLLKGAGSENMSFVKMYNPTTAIEDLIKDLSKEIKERAINSCPPLFIGIGSGGTMDYSTILSKKALFDGEESEFCTSLKTLCNQDKELVLSVKLLSSQTHIACMPVAVSINCHSNRHAKCIIENNNINYDFNDYKITPIEPDYSDYKKINIQDGMNDLKAGEKILLSGTIYTMRDMAHKKIVELIKNNQKLPFEIKNSVIFYAGPTPKKNNEIIGPIGPTTAKRMDKYAPLLYNLGCVATIGKGKRSEAVINSIHKNKAHYFSAQGGVACLLQKSFIKSEIVAFEELGTEAIYRFEIKDLPLTVEV